MRTGIILSLLLLLSSCFRKPIPINHFNAGKFILEDTAYKANEYLASFEDDAYPIYYLGPVTDTIHIGERYWRRRDNRFFREFPQYCVYKLSTTNISIEVDTLSVVCQPIEYLNDKRQIDRYSDSNRYFHASMLIIRNVSDTAVSFGYTFNVSQVHREMLNRRGQWVKVADKLCEGWMCVTGQPYLYLKPGELIVSKVSRFSGEHSVYCRLALGRSHDTSQVYSNTFTECIDDKLLRIVEGN